MTTKRNATGVERVMTLREFIQRKTEIEDRLRELRQQGFTVAHEVSTLGRQTADARARVRSLIESYGRGTESQVPTRRQGDLAALKAEASTQQKALLLAKERRDEISVEIDRLTEEREKLAYVAGIEEVKAHQARVAEATKRVEALQGAIQAQQRVIHEAEAAIPASSGLTQAREDLLADIATGAPEEEALADLDKAIEKERRAIAEAKQEADRIVPGARQAIAGLQRKLAAPQAELGQLAGERSELLFQFLLGQAAIINSEYEKLAVDLQRRFEQLLALDTLVQRYAPASHESTIMGLTQGIKVPAVTVVPHALRGGELTIPGFLFDTVSIDREASLGAEVKRLQRLGVEIAKP